MSTVTKDSLQLLVQLQGRDTALDRLKTRLEAVPKEIESLRRTIEDEKAKAESLKADSKKLQVEKKEKEVELASKEEAIRKHQNELNSVKTNEAFKALQKEIDSAKEDKGRIEEEILVLMDKGDELIRAEKSEARRVDEHAKAVESKVKELEADAERLRKEIEDKTAERNDSAGRVPAEMLKKYDFTRAHRPGAALVPVKEGVCGGCHMLLSPHVAVDMKKADRIVLCEGCQRILYPGELAPAGA